MKKLSRKIICILSSAVLFCVASGMTADAETNIITLESNSTEVNTSLREGITLKPTLNLSEVQQFPGDNYTKIPSGTLEPNDGTIDISLKASQKYTDLTLTQNEISTGKKAILEVKTQNTRYYTFGTVKYQWFGPNGLISGANSKTYETIVPGSYYCYVWIDYDFDDDDNSAAVLSEEGHLSYHVPSLSSHRNLNGSSFKLPAGRIWKVPEGAVKTDTATVRLVNELTIEKQPMNMPIYDFEVGSLDYGAEFSVSVTGGSGIYNYAWYNINSSEPIAFNQTLKTYDIGEYYCVIADDQGRTVKTDIAKSIGEPLCCHNKTNKRINIDNNGEYRNMDIDFEAGILNEEHIKTEFLVEWEEADIFQDNWKKIDSITTDKTVFTQKVYLTKDKQVRYNAYVLVNGKKCGQLTSGISTVTNPLNVTLDKQNVYKIGNDVYALFDVTGGYGDIELSNNFRNSYNSIYSSVNPKSYTPDRKVLSKAIQFVYVDYTSNEYVFVYYCRFGIVDEVRNSYLTSPETYEDQQYRGTIVQIDRTPYK